MFVEIDYLLIVECRSSSLFKQLCPSVDREFYGMPKLKGYVHYKAKTLLKSLGISEFLQCSFFISRKRRPSLADLHANDRHLSMGDYRIRSDSFQSVQRKTQCSVHYVLRGKQPQHKASCCILDNFKENAVRCC